MHFLMRIMQDYAGYQYTLVANEQIAAGGAEGLPRLCSCPRRWPSARRRRRP